MVKVLFLFLFETEVCAVRVSDNFISIESVVETAIDRVGGKRGLVTWFVLIVMSAISSIKMCISPVVKLSRYRGTNPSLKNCRLFRNHILKKLMRRKMYQTVSKVKEVQETIVLYF